MVKPNHYFQGAGFHSLILCIRHDNELWPLLGVNEKLIGPLILKSGQDELILDKGKRDTSPESANVESF